MMSANVVRVLGFVFLMSFQVSLDSALHVDVTPRTFNSLLSLEQSVDISCVPDDKDAREVHVFYMYIARKGEPSPLVIIKRNSSLSYSPDFKARLRASGHIDKDVSKCYLNVTILKPTSMDTWVYECVLNYLDEDKILKADKAIAYLKIDKPDMTTVEKVIKNLQETVDVLKLEVTNLKHTVSAMEEENQNLTRKVATVETENHRLTKKVEIKLAHHSKRPSSPTRFMKRPEGNSTDDDDWHLLLNKMDMMESKLWDLTSKNTYNITPAFTVTKDQNPMPLHIEKTIKFPDVLMQQGEGYNTTTGIFTAPTSGLYAFHLTAMTTCIGCYVKIDLNRNSKCIGRLEAWDGDGVDQSAISTAVVLHPGDQVYAVLANLAGDMENKMRGMFAGYLVGLS